MGNKSEPRLQGGGRVPGGGAGTGRGYRALLAFRPRRVGGPSQAMAEVFDGGLALFVGLNAFPGRATLTEYSCRIDARVLPALMRDRSDAVFPTGIPRGDSSTRTSTPSRIAAMTR